MQAFRYAPNIGLNMKATTVLFLLLTVCNVSAQTGTAPSADVAISISEGTPEYCVGEGASALLLNRGPDDDITLRLPLKVLYENHRSETIILPPWSHYLTRMTVDGQNGSTVLRNATRGIDVKGVMALSSPDSLFAIIPGGKYAWSTGLEWVLIPVRHLPSGLDLRGKTVQIVMTRRLSGAGTRRGGQAEREVEGLRDRLGRSCGVEYSDVLHSEGTADAGKLQYVGGAVVV